MISSYRFKNSLGIWTTIEVIIDGTEPALFNDFENTLHCSSYELKIIEENHGSGKSYRSIIESLPKLSEVEI